MQTKKIILTENFNQGCSKCNYLWFGLFVYFVGYLVGFLSRTFAKELLINVDVPWNPVKVSCGKFFGYGDLSACYRDKNFLYPLSKKFTNYIENVTFIKYFMNKLQCNQCIQEPYSFIIQMNETSKWFNSEECFF